MSGLPRGWVEERLSEVCELITDGTHHSPSNGAVGQFKYVTAKNIRKHGLDLTNITYVDAATHREIYKRCPVKVGDVLYIKDGATTGLAIVNPLDEEFSMLSSVALLRPLATLLDARFLRHQLNMRSLRDRMTGDMTGSAIRRLTLTTIGRQAVIAPPLAEQKRIVAKLDALNAKSARARTELARIETLVSCFKQAVLSKAFSGELAREWPLRSLDRLSDIIFDGPFGSNLKSADYTSEGPRVVRLENIGTRVFIEEKRTHISEEKFRSLARHLLQPNDLLFSSFVSEEIRACLFPADVDFQAINKADCFCIRLDKTKIDPQFALLQLTAEATYRHFVQKVHGATRPRINLSQLKHYPILVPPLEEQQEIVRRIESGFAKIDRLAGQANRALELVGRLDEAILAKAFRGELVPQDENDERAEHLLARIRAEREAAPKEKKRTVKRKSTMLTARDFLNAKLPNWPNDGISFQDLRSEFGGSYDDLKEAVFKFLSDENALLQQVFDEKRSAMTLRKREQ